MFESTGNFVVLLFYRKDECRYEEIFIILAALLALFAVTACQKKVEQATPAPAVESKPAEEAPVAVEPGQPNQTEPATGEQKQ